MKKIFYLSLLIILTLYSRASFADIAIMENVKSIIETGQEKVEVVMKEVHTVQKEVVENSQKLSEAKSQVEKGKSDIDGKISQVSNLKTFPLKVPEGIKNIEDPIKLNESIEKNMLAKPSGNIIADVQEQNTENLDRQREKLADLYARAFVTRYNISKEAENTEKRKTDMDIAAATKDINTEIAKRYNNILSLELTIQEYESLEASDKYFGEIAEEEKEEGAKND